MIDRWLAVTRGKRCCARTPFFFTCHRCHDASLERYLNEEEFLFTALPLPCYRFLLSHSALLFPFVSFFEVAVAGPLGVSRFHTEHARTRLYPGRNLYAASDERYSWGSPVNGRRAVPGSSLAGWDGDLDTRSQGRSTPNSIVHLPALASAPPRRRVSSDRPAQIIGVVIKIS